MLFDPPVFDHNTTIYISFDISTYILFSTALRTQYVSKRYILAMFVCLPSNPYIDHEKKDQCEGG